MDNPQDNVNVMIKMMQLHPEWTELEWERFFNASTRFMTNTPTSPMQGKK